MSKTTSVKKEEQKLQNIDRSIFNKEDQRTEDLHLQLSEKYMVYKDLADRCIINPAQIDKQEHRVFYIRPDTIFTQEPRYQNQFRNEFIRQVSAPPIPEPFTLMADDIFKQMLEDVKDQSTPLIVRDKLCKFFQRRQFKLQHKKHKYLSRWSHFALTSEIVDKVSINFQPSYSKIQFELEQSVKRHQRLEGDDHFDNKPRPQRIEPNGLINSDDVNVEQMRKHCTIRLDDIDVFNRAIGYEGACSKHSEKFVSRAKWVAVSHRFDIYIQAQERLQGLKQSAIERQRTWQNRMKKKGSKLIDDYKMGDRGEKELVQIENTLTFVKHEKKVRTARDTYLQTANYNQELPPMILWNQIDLKLTLEDLCRDFNISGNMEVDDGNSFSYAVIVQFPTIFFGQMVKTQFAPYDAVPQVLNPAELGRLDISNVIENNIKKYGKGAPGSTLLEQLEIKKQSEQMKIQYINQIEKALFGEFNNGQLEDFPRVRLKTTHWLPYVCFKAEISKEQMQQAALLSSDLNKIDQVAANMLEIVNINDITNVNLTLESLSQIHYDKLRSGKVRSDFIHLDHSDTDSIFTEGQKAFLKQYMSMIKIKADLGYKNKNQQDEPELPKNSLYDPKQHLLFAQYLMVCLKAREHKNKLLYILNAFRSIQKRIALELRELSSRDRVTFDCNIVEPKEKSEAGIHAQTGGDSFDEKKGELHVESVVMDEMIDINRFKFNGQIQNFMWSTCPILPKFHITFGEPIERQEVSTEFEVNSGQDPRHKKAISLLGRIDFLKEHEQSGTVLVTDDYGVNIMYDCTFADMRVLEQELLKIMSYFINKLEPLQDTDLRNIFPVVDRFNLVKEIIMCEERYQKAKLQLAYCYLEAYEHVCDTLEQQRIIQMIVDLMAKRPRINLAANHFYDSYNVEIQILETQIKLFKEFIQMQIDNELKVNHEIREALEKSYRLIYEQIDNKWQYFESSEVRDEQDKRQLATLGVKNESDQQKLKKVQLSNPGMFQAKQPQITVQQFADMMGITIANMQMLLKEHHERDPLVKTSIHESVSFIKLQEGYPTFFTTTELSQLNKVQIVPGAQKIGILEIFESLSSIAKVQAACHHSQLEIHEVHQPDNGLVSSMYDLVTMEFLLAELRSVKAESRGNQVMQSRDLEVIDDHSVLGNSDKMLFYIKELSASREDSSLIKNPFIFAKLDMKALIEFDFDGAQQDKFKKKEQKKLQQQKNQDHSIQSLNQSGQRNMQMKKPDSEFVRDLDTVDALQKMLEDPENSVSEHEDENDDLKNKLKLGQGGRETRYQRIKKNLIKPNIPPMLELQCNAVEVMRLRHLLVEAYHQRAALIPIYTNQCKAIGKEPKVFFKDAFNFETHLSGGENWTNFVDQGPGHETYVQSELSIKEFDPTLLANLNFSDPEAFKALVCPLGLEELRCVVRYELVNLQTLILAVRHNQILIDNCQRQLAEIELFEKGFLVSAPACDIMGKLQGNQFETNLKRVPENERRKLTQRLIEKVGKCSYSVITRKNRPKEFVESAYKKIRQQIIDKRFEKVEIGLRYLRTSRMLLCHDFCTDIESALFLDAIRLELINETNQMRKRAYLLPREAMVHQLPVPKYGEHSYAAYNEETYDTGLNDLNETDFWLHDKKQISNFWKIPNFFECCTLNLQLEQFQKNNLRKLYSYNVESITEIQKQLPLLNNIMDQNQKTLIQGFIPNVDRLDLEQSEQTLKLLGRFVDYKQAPKLENSIVFKYLFYFRQLQNLFDLEYFRNKLATKADSIATLEQCVMSGLPFWETPSTQNTVEDNYQIQEEVEIKNDKNIKNIPYSQQQDEIEFRNKLAEQIVLKMTEEKRVKNQLMTELDSLKDTFNLWGKKMEKQQLSSDIAQSGEFLSELVQISFYNTFLSLQLVRQKQAENGDAQKEIQSINDLIKIIGHMDETKVTYTNGYHVNTAATSIGRISLEDSPHKPDYNSFFLATQPVIDEQGLNPIEFNLINGMYTSNSVQIKQYRRIKPYLGWIAPRDFHYLDLKLLNVTRDLRKYIAANVKDCTELSLEFAHQKLKISENIYQANFNTQMEVFNEQKQFSRMQIKSNKLKTVLIILMTKQLLPNDVQEMAMLLKEFNDLFSWKVMNKVDEVVKHRLMLAAQAQSRALDTGVKQIQHQIGNQDLQQTKKKREQVHQIIQQFDLYSCEVEVYQREIQNFMILTGKRMIERETTSLAKAFEVNGKRLEVLIDVHQQFAATFDSSEDKRNHLDIVNKVAPVQKMLTQIKNRMLVIKTLTGGEGIIIRTKDLNSILEDLCRSIIKNGEIEMRTRCEQLSLQIIQYENLLYAKDQQLFNMEHKLRHAKDELNKIINTKVFSKGNQLIYEFDHSQRQFRLVKDNIYLMESKLKDEIRLQFDKDLEQSRLELVELKKKFSEYQITLNSHVKADISNNINQLDTELKHMIQKRNQPIDYNAEKSDNQLVDEYAHLLQGEAKKEYKEAQLSGIQQKNAIYNSKDLIEIFRENEKLKASEREAREELLQMQNLMRKQRMLQNFKWLIAQRKWDEKVDNLKQQLTSNSTLWEQLAESEKREQVLKKELQRTQEEVASQDKIVERLKDELKFEQLEKHKLLNFKETKLKRLNQLEDMSKQMELLQSIDLDKVLGSMGSKEKQLEQLKSETKDGAEVIAQIYRSKNKEVSRTRELALNESKIKDAALHQMEALRAEIQLLQSGDLTSMNLWKDKVQKLKEQKSEIMNQLSSNQFDQSKSHLINQTSGKISMPVAIGGQQTSLQTLGNYSGQQTPTRKSVSGVKVLPNLSVRNSGKTSKKKHTNIFDQLLQDSQMINSGSQYKEPLSTRKFAQKLEQDSLMQNSIQSSITPKQYPPNYGQQNSFMSDATENDNLFTSLANKQQNAQPNSVSNHLLEAQRRQNQASKNPLADYIAPEYLQIQPGKINQSQMTLPLTQNQMSRQPDSEQGTTFYKTIYAQEHQSKIPSQASGNSKQI